EAHVTAGSTNFLQSFSGFRTRRDNAVVPLSGTAEMRQTAMGAGFDWRTDVAWRVSLGFTHYDYNRDTGKFQNQLDSPFGSIRGLGGFSDLVGGLPRETYRVKITYVFSDEWQAALSEQLAIADADTSASTVTKASVEYGFTPQWHVSTGIGWDKSNKL